MVLYDVVAGYVGPKQGELRHGHVAAQGGEAVRSEPEGSGGGGDQEPRRWR